MSNQKKKSEGLFVCGACCVAVDSEGNDSSSINMFTDVFKARFGRARRRKTVARIAS